MGYASAPSRFCALDSLVEVVLEGTSSRTVCSGSFCSGGFGGHLAERHAPADPFGRIGYID